MSRKYIPTNMCNNNKLFNGDAKILIIIYIYIYIMYWIMIIRVHF